MDEKTINILKLLDDLKTATPSQREEWKSEVLDQFPHLEKFVNQAVKIVSGGEEYGI